jgi:hypothetical protein
MKILNNPQKLLILLRSIGSLSMVGLCLLDNLANAQTIADSQRSLIAQSNNSDRLAPPTPNRSKGDLPVGSTKIDITGTDRDPIKKIVGTWVNNDADPQGITKLIIAKSGNRHSVHLFKKCNPIDCDLGKKLLTASFWENSGSTHIMAIYKESIALRELQIYSPLRLEISPPSEIRVSFSIIFTDPSRRPIYSGTEIFRKI